MQEFTIPQAFKHSARMLDALADQNRVRILCLLGAQGRLSVGDIASNFTMSRPAISHHLKVMLDAGLLLNQKAGQEVYYWVDCDGIIAALRKLADAVEGCCRGGKCC